MRLLAALTATYLVISIAWVIKAPGFDSAALLVSALIALLTLAVADNRRRKPAAARSMEQAEVEVSLQNSGQRAIQATGGVTNSIQISGNVTLSGMSYSEVRAIATDIYKDNFLIMSKEARETVDERVELIVEKIIVRLKEKHPDGFEGARDPGFQQSLFEVQKQYGTKGDENLGEMLVDLLVSRTATSSRELLQIVLDDAIRTASNVTPDQISALSAIFLFCHTESPEATTQEKFGEYLDLYVPELLKDMPMKKMSVGHLQFTGCATLLPNGKGELFESIRRRYIGLFLQGFDKVEAELIIEKNFYTAEYFIACLNDRTRMQINARNDTDLLYRLNRDPRISPRERDVIKQLFHRNMLTPIEVARLCMNIRPYMQKLSANWAANGLARLSLTPVGIAIAHANLQRIRPGAHSDLAAWIK